MTERVINLARNLYTAAMSSATGLGDVSDEQLTEVAEQVTDICFKMATVFELEASRRYHEMQENRPPLVADPSLRQ